jgi:predicted DNA-binding transcriptional regulator AlpA
MGHVFNTAATELRLSETEELWTADQCAKYLGFSRVYFMNNISKRTTFPDPSPVGLRWVRSEVTAWATNS